MESVLKWLVNAVMMYEVHRQTQTVVRTTERDSKQDPTKLKRRVESGP